MLKPKEMQYLLRGSGKGKAKEIKNYILRSSGTGRAIHSRCYTARHWIDSHLLESRYSRVRRICYINLTPADEANEADAISRAIIENSGE